MSQPVETPRASVVEITARGEQRVRQGHPWIYRADVVDVAAAGGDIVRVLGPRGRTIGYAFFSDQSQIPIRMLTRGDHPADDALLRSRLERALRYRESLHIEADAYRLVHGEADLLPSLVVDRYGAYLVVQALSQATDRLLPDVVRHLEDLLRPAGILARNDAKVRTLEGLPQTVALVSGSVPESVHVTEGGIGFDVDVRHDQKTGLFLDQRENREAAARYAHGRLLDCFSYHGGFALRLARHCETVEAVDVSGDAVSRINANAASNGAANVLARQANVFDELRSLERSGARYQTIVLDPPAFAKNKASVQQALAGYKEINLRAIRLLSPGGFLVTCSCSYNVSEDLFADVVRDAAVDSHAAMTLVEKRTQGRDHPVLVGVPETYYLKCFILRRAE